MSLFKKATKTQARLRMALYGVSGSGKTYSALAIAAGLTGRVAVIDTERGSASKYANLFNFDVLEMQPPFSPSRYIEAIKASEAEGYDVLIIDSLSHAWSGSGGALEMVDNAAKRSGGNSFAAWRDVTPEHNKLIDAIIQAGCHVIATMRSKTEYVMEQDSRGKNVPRKKAMAPIQRDGMEYEFDVVAEMDADNNMIVQKSRCPALTGQIVNRPNGDTSKALRAWLMDGVAPAPMPVAAAIPPAAPPDPTLDNTIDGLVERAQKAIDAMQEHGKQPGPKQVEALRDAWSTVWSTAAEKGLEVEPLAGSPTPLAYAEGIVRIGRQIIEAEPTHEVMS